MNIKNKKKLYHNYVIKNGKLIGDFENLYKDIDNPWGQNDNNVINDTRKAIVKNFIKKLSKTKNKIIVSEIGCGFGNTTNILNFENVSCFGTDISETAISKAREKFPKYKFEVCEFLNFDIHYKMKTQVFLLQEITWYVLPHLNIFIKKLIEYKKKTNKEIYLIHLLTIYKHKEQKYGLEYFSNQDQILKYFGLNYEEYGEIKIKNDDGVLSPFTYFISKI